VVMQSSRRSSFSVEHSDSWFCEETTSSSFSELSGSWFVMQLPRHLLNFLIDIVCPARDWLT
jgi:hypothetical protein